jgi:hypothetical protein
MAASASSRFSEVSEDELDCLLEKAIPETKIFKLSSPTISNSHSHTILTTAPFRL